MLLLLGLASRSGKPTPTSSADVVACAGCVCEAQSLRCSGGRRRHCLDDLHRLFESRPNRPRERHECTGSPIPRLTKLGECHRAAVRRGKADGKRGEQSLINYTFRPRHILDHIIHLCIQDEALCDNSRTSIAQADLMEIASQIIALSKLSASTAMELSIAKAWLGQVCLLISATISFNF